jgi:hypothetical protein
MVEATYLKRETGKTDRFKDEKVGFLQEGPKSSNPNPSIHGFNSYLRNYESQVGVTIIIHFGNK